MLNVRKVLVKAQKKGFSNGTQKALATLLAADGEWLPRSSFRQSSPTSRIRDLRTSEFGNFVVECKSSKELGKGNRHHTFYYKLNMKSVTASKLECVFGEGVVQ